MHTELVELRSFYAPPGFILVARHHDTPVGCVALRALEPAVGEVRRLYIAPEHRSDGAGRRLADRLMADARAAGIARLVLNTLPTMTHALALYRDLGFEPIAPYVPNPTDGIIYLGRDLPRAP